MDFVLSSAAFSDAESIPRKYTCEGVDISPPLAWRGAPAATQSFVLIVDDPDAPDPAAPKMTWVHWLLYNIAPDTAALSEALGQLPEPMRAGRNDWHRTVYGGPCPPIGRHRYYFKLYALDVMLADLGSPTKAALEAQMAGHILAQATLMGTYQKHSTA